MCSAAKVSRLEKPLENSSTVATVDLFSKGFSSLETFAAESIKTGVPA